MVFLCVLAGPAFASGEENRIQVFYPRAECAGEEIEVDVWDRDYAAWRRHPEHAYVPVETCQEEQAGRLLHELRWRCRDRDPETTWHVGLDVFNPEISQSCEVRPIADAQSRAQIHVASPHEAAIIKWKKGFALVDGSVRVDGVEGVEYELVIALDRSGSAPDASARLAAQVKAARRFVASVNARLGDLRIGVVAFPGVNTPARVMTRPSADRGAIDLALNQALRLGASGDHAFSEGLEAALDLLAPADVKPERPRARPVVAIASDGASVPFAPGSTSGVRELVERARSAGVRVHAFALAGHAHELSPLANKLAERTHGSVRRVPSSALSNNFFAAVRLPLPEAVTIYNPRTQDTTRARLDANGRFRAAVPMAAGDNPLTIVATTTDRSRGERDWKVRYDAMAARDAFLEGERERIRRVRARKNLQISPVRDELAARKSVTPVPGSLDD